MSRWRGLYNKFDEREEEWEAEIGEGVTVIVWMGVPKGYFPVKMAYLEDGEWLEATTDNPIEYPVLAWYDLPDYGTD